MKKRLKWTILGAAALVVVVMISYSRVARFWEEGDLSPVAEKKAEKVLPVRIMIPEKNTIDDIFKVAGSVMANESVDLRCESSGTITALHFQEGQYVKKGTLLLETNNEDLKALLSKQKHTLELNQKTSERQKQLLDKEAISREEYEISMNELFAIQSDIQHTKALIRKSQIYAPFNGKIGLRFVSEGAYIDNNVVVASLFNMDVAKIEFSVPEKYALEMRPGKKIYFTVAGQTQRFEAVVYAQESNIKESTRSLKIRARCSRNSDRLIAGQFANIQVVLNSFEEAMLLPTYAVVPELDVHKIYVLNGGVAEEREVELGVRTENKVQILSGLKSSDRVIISGLHQIKDGMRVLVKEVDA
ncbi:efflux RND transporter periplasmic adaptor subunit [Persicobacter sp. CCB-QB2]|uniref:efflux RND transporter periplasmic adaptor subunit n=1 Tax=Persicobacter sp. CCB-QB2 TaxID=1561025 RepID=UPI0006A9B958|nr:efflux RND transporter periplasmic adaptor subunit [Persicobacter sp. CCB-QB2]